MPRNSPVRWMLVAAHLVPFALVLMALSVFLRRSLPPAGACLALAAGAGLIAVMQAWRAERRGGLAGWIGLAGAGVAAWLLVRAAATGLSPGQAAYVLLAGTVLGAGFQGVVKIAALWSDTGRGAEALRLGSLLALAVWLFRPFLNPDFFGGMDARWYGYAMTDALQQARAGVFPVLVGQSEFMSDGSINPIRLAPYYQNFGIILDGLTARALPPVAVQHWTVLMTAMLSTAICYLCLTALQPARRWLAWVLSALYVSAPALAAFIYSQEMQMTFLAFAWLPLVMFANVRLIRRDDFAGWVWLSTGLALVWFCHAPIGAWVTLCTLALQGLRLLARDFQWASWRRAAGGGVLFGVLTAGYFWPVAELSQAGGGSPGNLPVYSLALALALGAVIRHLATGRWRWLALAVLATGVLWVAYRDYGRWLVAAVLLAASLVRADARWPRLKLRERVPEWTMAVLVLGGVLTLRFALPAGEIPGLAVVRRLFPDSLQPVIGAGRGLGDIQIGYGLWLVLIMGLIAAVIRPTWENRLFSLMGLVLVAVSLPVPGLTRFILSAVPDPIVDISSTTLWVRYLPLLVVVAVFLGFLSGDVWLGRPSRVAIRLILLAVLMLGWSVRESEKFVRHGYRVINGPEEVRAFYRPENIRLFSFILRNLPASPYMTNGVVDYLLESRLLRADDPAVEALPPLDWTKVREVTLTTKADDSTPGRLPLEPKFLLAPGERLALRFEFFDKPYAGRLICQGPNGFYREYFLPAAGFFGKSFGVAPERPKIISLWNTSDQPQPLELIFLSDDVPAKDRPFGDFAKVAMQAYTPEQLPVNTLGLIPYRARVRAGEAMYLETPRAFVPGYAATVNGLQATVTRSPNNRAMVKLPVGDDLVEVGYPGTPALRLTFLLSALGWCGVTVLAFRQWRHLSRLRIGLY